jgi:hypothetical protein
LHREFGYRFFREHRLEWFNLLSAGCCAANTGPGRGNTPFGCKSVAPPKACRPDCAAKRS